MGERAMPGNASSRLAVASLGGTYRMVVPVIAPSLIVMLLHEGQQGFWLQFFVMGVYMLAVGAAFVSLGLAISGGRRRNGRTIAILTVCWAFANGGSLALAGAMGGPSGWSALFLGMGCPFLAVWSLATRMMQASGDKEGAVACAFMWSIIYVVAAWLLLRRARKQSRGEDAAVCHGGDVAGRGACTRS